MSRGGPSHLEPGAVTALRRGKLRQILHETGFEPVEVRSTYADQGWLVMMMLMAGRVR